MQILCILVRLVHGDSILGALENFGAALFWKVVSLKNWLNH